MDEYGETPTLELSSQSQSSRTVTIRKAPKRATKTTETKKTNLSKGLAATKRDILKVSTNGHAGPVRRLGLSKKAVPRGPPSPVRI